MNDIKFLSKQSKVTRITQEDDVPYWLICEEATIMENGQKIYLNRPLDKPYRQN